MSEVVPMHIIAVMQIVTTPSKVRARANYYIGESVIGSVLVAQLVALDLVIVRFDGGLEPTEKALRWFDMICDTPFPVKKWVDPRKGGPK